jgi:hypothetical protein
MVPSLSPTRRVVAAVALAFVVASIAWSLVAFSLTCVYDLLWEHVPLWIADASAVLALIGYARWADRRLRRPGRGAPAWALLPALGGFAVAALDGMGILILIVLGSTGPVPVDNLPIGRMFAIVVGCPACVIIGLMAGFRGVRRG